MTLLTWPLENMITDTISPHPIVPEKTQDTDRSAAKTPDCDSVDITNKRYHVALCLVMRHGVQFSSRGTCHAFRDAMDSGIDSLHIDWFNWRYSDWYNPGTAQYRDLQRILSRLPQLRSLTASGIGCPNMGFGTNALEACLYLTTVNFSNSNVIGISALQTCPKLETVVLSNTDVRDISALSSVYSVLTTLNLKQCENLSFDPLRGCRALTCLDLSLFRHSEPTFNIDPLKECTALTSLHLGSCEDLVDIGPLKACTNMATQDLSGCVKLVDIGPLAACKNLIYLNLAGYVKLVDTGLLAACNKLIAEA